MARTSTGGGDTLHKIGPYEIREWLGEGGMGEVCRAYDTRLDRQVAIKRILLRKLSKGTVRERFRREARAVARLNHPSIVQIYDLMTTESMEWIVMEFVEGETLSRRLRQGPVDPAVALTLMSDVAEGLAEAHEHGLVHRDIKAENVMITPRGRASAGGSAPGRASACRAKILDFGLARPMEPGDETLTMTGAVVGTPHAMSPEQASGATVDHRSDLFSFGSLFFFAVTGRHPFRAPKVLETLRRVRTRRQVPAHSLRPEVPVAVSELIDQLLEKKPADRPQTAEEVARRLRELGAAPFAVEGRAAAAAPEPRREEASEPLWQDEEDDEDTTEQGTTASGTTIVSQLPPEEP